MPQPETPDPAALRSTLRRLIGLGHPEFGRVVHRLKAATGADICLLSLSDGEHQRPAARLGPAAAQIDGEVTFVAYVMGRADPLVVDDARADWRFRYSPVVLCEPFIRAYAGRALRVGAQPVGTLCAAARSPGAFAGLDLALLVAMVEQVEQVLEAEAGRAPRSA